MLSILVFLLLSGADSRYEITVSTEDLQDANAYIGQHALFLKKDIREKWPEYPMMHTLFTRSYRSNAENCWQIFAADNTVFMTTGDIRRMWLRDSTAQMQAYIPLLAASSSSTALKNNKGAVALDKVFQGVLRRQVRFLASDVYGSAFYNRTGMGKSQGPNRDECPRTEQCPDCTANKSSPDCGPWTYQKDFELDSPCAVLRLHLEYLRATNNTKIFDDEIKLLFNQMLQLFETEQRHYSKSSYFYKAIPYKSNDDSEMIWSFARPSDDQQVYGFNIPNNMALVVALDDIAYLSTAFFHDEALAERAQALAQSVRSALAKHGIISFNGKQNRMPSIPFPRSSRSRNATARYRSKSSRTSRHRIQRKPKPSTTHRRRLFSFPNLDLGHEPPAIGEKIWAYEVDGFGKYIQMDDANLPNLLGISLSGFSLGQDINSKQPAVNETALYIATRKFSLSIANPTFYIKTWRKDGNTDPAAGLGSRHITAIRSRPGELCFRACIWPLGLIVQAMTAVTIEERDLCLRMLYENTNGTYLMHEGFNSNDSSRYNRDFFGWANALVSILIFNLLDPNAKIPSARMAWATMHPPTTTPPMFGRR